MQVVVFAKRGCDDQVGGGGIQEHAADEANLRRLLGQIDV